MLRSEAVAVKFSQLYNPKNGRLKFSTKAALAEYFHFTPSAKVIVIGVGDDPSIEPYWSTGRGNNLYKALESVKPDLVTSPNFSVFPNVPRWDNLHNIKRIAICWSELVTGGIAASLHLNARCDRDWERWSDFISDREEVQSITVEFATGNAVRSRGQKCVDQLVRLATKVGRPIQLIVKGGSEYIPELSTAFSNLVFVDTTSFMKTVNYKRFTYSTKGSIKWEPANVTSDQSLDALFQHNVDSLAKHLTKQFRSHIDLVSATAEKHLPFGT